MCDLYDCGGHAENHVRKAAAAVLSLKTFHLADERFENLAAGREALAALDVFLLFTDEFDQRGCQSPTGCRARNRGKLPTQLLAGSVMVALDTSVFESLILDLFQIVPFHEGLAEIAYPSEFLLKPRQIEFRRAFRHWRVDEPEHLRAPTNQRAKIHVAGFDFLRGRREVSQFRLLDPGLGLPAVLDERIPARVGKQFSLEKDGRLVSQIIEDLRFRMFLPELGRSIDQLGTLVAQDSQGHTDLFRHRFQLTVNLLTVRFLNRFEGKQGQIMVCQWSVELLPDRLPDADHPQTLPSPQLQRVIDQKNPAVGFLFGTREFVQPDTQQPRLHRVGRRYCRQLRKPFVHDAQHRTARTKTD